MTVLQDELARAAIACGLKITLDPKIELASGRTLVALAHIRGVGARNGMVIVTSFEQVRDLTDELINSDYGFSVLDEPNKEEPFELDSYIELFKDWGWSTSTRQPG